MGDDTKHGGCLFLVCIVGMILGCKSAGLERVGLVACLQQCMPVCLDIDGATDNACLPACKQYCRQVHNNVHPDYCIWCSCWDSK